MLSVLLLVVVAEEVGVLLLAVRADLPVALAAGVRGGGPAVGMDGGVLIIATSESSEWSGWSESDKCARHPGADAGPGNDVPARWYLA